MEARVSNLEEGLREARSDLRAVRDLVTGIDAKLAALADKASLAGLEVKVAELSGAIRQLPTTFQMISLTVGLAVGLSGALLGGFFILLRFALKVG